MSKAAQRQNHLKLGYLSPKTSSVELISLDVGNTVDLRQVKLMTYERQMENYRQFIRQCNNFPESWENTLVMRFHYLFFYCLGQAVGAMGGCTIPGPGHELLKNELSQPLIRASDVIEFVVIRTFSNLDQEELHVIPLITAGNGYGVPANIDLAPTHAKMTSTKRPQPKRNMFELCQHFRFIYRVWKFSVRFNTFHSLTLVECLHFTTACLHGCLSSQTGMKPTYENKMLQIDRKIPVDSALTNKVTHK